MSRPPKRESHWKQDSTFETQRKTERGMAVNEGRMGTALGRSREGHGEVLVVFFGILLLVHFLILEQNGRRGCIVLGLCTDQWVFLKTKSKKEKK